MSIYRIIDINHLKPHEYNMLKTSIDSIKLQTDTWHLNSPKKVCACIYLPTREDYIVGQNIGISKVTGTLCAERSAVAAAVVKYPDLRFQEITDIFVLGEGNPTLPCGICCEWLYKINPDINIYTLKDDGVLKINISNYYGDEATIDNR